MDRASLRVGVIGLGYVGLPLALAFGRVMETLGFDIHEKKLAAYRRGVDPTGEMSAEQMRSAAKLRYSSDPAALADCDFLVVAVPTPVDAARQPDLTPVIRASESIAPFLKAGAVVIYESTVYPGVTEEVCVPVLERGSGKRRGRDFFMGYSPERINPGDHEHRLENIVKVVAGEDAATLDKVAWLYTQIVEAGVYRASSIRVAEAAKVIENTQRDVNIALINELALIFHRLGIDTREVLDAAATKWNFLRFSPGLVGGHCIGVDPYYLTYKAQELGYHPEVILAGRRINDGMGAYIAKHTVKRVIQAGLPVKGARILVMGFTFKENCADTRNTRVVDIVAELRDYGAEVVIWDPVADPEEVRHEYGLALSDWQAEGEYVAVVAAVAHAQVCAIDLQSLARCCQPGAVFMDVKSAFDRQALRDAGMGVWRL